MADSVQLICSSEVIGTSIEQMAYASLLLDVALRAYGRHLFGADVPLYVFTLTVLAVNKEDEHLKTLLKPPWKLVRRRQGLTPPHAEWSCLMSF